MSSAAVEGSGTTSAADIARRAEKQPVEADEPQLVLGVVAQTFGLERRIKEALKKKGWTWRVLGKALGYTRQGVICSINRRHVQYSRVKEIAAVLGISTESLLIEEWDCAANEEIL